LNSFTNGLLQKAVQRKVAQHGASITATKSWSLQWRTAGRRRRPRIRRAGRCN